MVDVCDIKSSSSNIWYLSHPVNFPPLMINFASEFFCADSSMPLIVWRKNWIWEWLELWIVVWEWNISELWYRCERVYGKILNTKSTHSCLVCIYHEMVRSRKIKENVVRFRRYTVGIEGFYEGGGEGGCVWVIGGKKELQRWEEWLRWRREGKWVKDICSTAGLISRRKSSGRGFVLSMGWRNWTSKCRDKSGWCVRVVDEGTCKEDRNNFSDFQFWFRAGSR